MREEAGSRAAYPKALAVLGKNDIIRLAVNTVLMINVLDDDPGSAGAAMPTISEVPTEL